MIIDSGNPKKKLIIDQSVVQSLEVNVDREPVQTWTDPSKMVLPTGATMTLTLSGSGTLFEMREIDPADTKGEDKELSRLRAQNALLEANQKVQRESFDETIKDYEGEIEALKDRILELESKKITITSAPGGVTTPGRYGVGGVVSGRHGVAAFPGMNQHGGQTNAAKIRSVEEQLRATTEHVNKAEGHYRSLAEKLEPKATPEPEVESTSKWKTFWKEFWS